MRHRTSSILYWKWDWYRVQSNWLVAHSIIYRILINLSSFGAGQNESVFLRSPKGRHGSFIILVITFLKWCICRRGQDYNLKLIQMPEAQTYPYLLASSKLCLCIKFVCTLLKWVSFWEKILERNMRWLVKRWIWTYVKDPNLEIG